MAKNAIALSCLLLLPSLCSAMGTEDDTLSTEGSCSAGCGKCKVKTCLTSLCPDLRGAVTENRGSKCVALLAGLAAGYGSYKLNVAEKVKNSKAPEFIKRRAKFIPALIGVLTACAAYRPIRRRAGYLPSLESRGKLFKRGNAVSKSDDSLENDLD